jgi:hypothetical protein
MNSLNGTSWSKISGITESLLFGDSSFTRSNGAVISKLYERLTKRSRRAQAAHTYPGYPETQEAYRQGVYDAFKALQKELSV